LSLGRVLILGANGQVGRELQRAFADAGELVCYDRRQADLADPGQLRDAVRNASPDLILNAAAYTAVDRAETDRDAAMAINAHAPRILAEEASRRGILLVHYSTDYVFDGSKESPWAETDTTNPLNVYGATKLAGERAIVEAGGKHLIFRTSWVYGPQGKNFLLTMLRLAGERDRLSIVNDQTGAPTTSIAIADATRTVVDEILSGGHQDAHQDWAGIYHMTCAGSTTWCGFAREIFALSGLLLAKTPEVVPIASAEYPTPATRPRNSVLSNEKLLTRFGVRMPAWEDALEAALAQLRKA
jgi:dTDP-4-dehydrorhamnose reductase